MTIKGTSLRRNDMEQKKTYYISADIEGITDVTSWEETIIGCHGYEKAAEQMTRETAAACQAILDAGFDVVVRDGHESALNIDHRQLPVGAKLMRGWACHPGSMVAGIDEKYAGILYIGYHAPSGSDGSPLAHTTDHDKINWMKINGKLASELTYNSLFAAQFAVPSIFLSGDKMMCDMAQDEINGIVTVAVKECRGNSTFNIHPDTACQLIYDGVGKAIKADIPVISIPDKLVMEINLKEFSKARSALAMPGVELIDATTVRYTAKDPTELNVMREYIMG